MMILISPCHAVQVSHFHGRFQYLFIESSCDDPKVLEQNYMAKMRYSPDYKNMESAQVCVYS